MKKTLLTLSLCAALLGMMTAPASAVILMDEDINISFSFSKNFNSFLPNEDRYTIDNNGLAADHYSGRHSLEEAHPEDLNVWGGQALIFEEQLGGTAVTGPGADATDAQRDLSQFDGDGQVRLSWWYKILQPIDLNSDGNPDNDTTTPNILPVTSLSLRYNDGDNLDDMGAAAPGNEDITSIGTYDMIVDGTWHQAEVIVDVLSAAARAALDEGGNDDSDIATVWRLETDISTIQSELVGQTPSFAGAPTFFFIDQFEMTALADSPLGAPNLPAVPEPATLGLLGIGCLLTTLRRRRA